MFTPGQSIFAICFLVVFVIIIIIAYTRDKKLHKKYYKNNFWVLIGFLIFTGLLMLAKWLLKD